MYWTVLCDKNWKNKHWLFASFERTISSFAPNPSHLSSVYLRARKEILLLCSSFWCTSSSTWGVTFDNPVTAKPLRSMASRHNWCKEESCFPNTEKSLHQNRCILNTRAPQEESPGFHPDAWQRQNQPRSRRESHIAEHNDRKQFKGRCIRPSGNGKKTKSGTPTIREQ